MCACMFCLKPDATEEETMLFKTTAVTPVTHQTKYKEFSKGKKANLLVMVYLTQAAYHKVPVMSHIAGV